MILFLGYGFIANALSVRLDKLNIKHRIISNNIVADPPDRILADIGSIKADDKLLDGVETVVYLAHSSVPYSSMQNVYKDAEQNILTAIGLFELFAKRRIRVIYISSGGSVYGNHPGIMTEESLPSPISAYGLSKYTIENYLKLFHHNHQLPYDILRLSNIYGIGQKNVKPQGIISALAQSFIDRKTFKVWGDGNAKKDYLYIDDLTDALVRVISKPALCETFNISYGESNSVSEIISIFEANLSYSIGFENMPAFDFDVRNVFLDNSKFANEYDWKPATDLETGVKKTIEWFNNSASR